jgi:hypothetical protein
MNTYEKFILNTSKTNKAVIDNKISPQSSDTLSINNNNNPLKIENKNIEIKKSKPIVNMFKKIFKNKELPQKPMTPIENIYNLNRNTEIMVENDMGSLVGMNSDDLGMFIKYLYSYVLKNLLRNIPY